MTRLPLPTHPLMLGFDELERLIDRAAKSSHDSYPPYNIERLEKTSEGPEVLRITVAVAGFDRNHLEIQLEDKQLSIRGKQTEEVAKIFIYRGIATRQFNRTFVLADGLEVRSADLKNGLLTVDLVRLQPERNIKTIVIGDNKSRV
jgi:HSP20 family molecular chaperone IbpA